MALGLTKPNQDKTRPEFEAEELIELYENEGKIIFQRKPEKKLGFLKQTQRDILGSILARVAPSIEYPEDLFNSKYTRQGKGEIIKKYLGSTYIKEALREILITSYITNLRMPLFFTSNPDKEQKYKEAKNFRVICEGFKMEQAALATSAAPTYFKPYALTALNRKDPAYTLIDGGVVANNPTSIAIIEAMTSYQMKTGENINLDEILVVSLGTGNKSSPLNIEDINNWGMVKWIEPLINMVFNGQSEVVDYQMEQLLSPKLQRNMPEKQYYRFQPQYHEVKIDPKTVSVELSAIDVNDAMDDAREYNVQNLKAAAINFINQEESNLDSLCKQLELLSNKRTKNAL